MDHRLADDNPRGLYFLADLVNAVQDGDGATPQGLQAVVDAHGGPPLRLTEAAAEQVRQAAAAVAAILDTDDEDSAAEAINTLLDRYPARPRLVRLPGRRWSLHTAAPHHPDPARWLLSTAALALALWLGERGRCAWGRCAAPGCDRYFIDTGRRAPQRYCSARCGTRVRVAAHRDRGR
ncbi:CGNR zinc finger domain-containing protein [Streptomyces sp. SID8366]|uniref:CGNR zinc finger domain-containing protein n=1 Tax=unclassified Streptomyces TaxID=2593676 RepID=UPI000DB9999B|nr:CGNR zinc finger domain-containing protein [Streptomyces sp. PsTaAH-130]MYU06364.1 CGNR zinc finger domain-containing protein [Streptomyces sp. SID8366]MYU61560.1 CGNR zinc finger domain-containing protein [Streptomyces sp. SID69]RAJ47953.1 putative stress-induced transcription regulator [Streptomyces sp. PsTaAH-130]